MRKFGSNLYCPPSGIQVHFRHLLRFPSGTPPYIHCSVFFLVWTASGSGLRKKWYRPSEHPLYKRAMRYHIHGVAQLARTYLRWDRTHLWPSVYAIKELFHRNRQPYPRAWV